MVEALVNESDVDFESALRVAIAEANVPTLQVLYVQLTGDERYLAPPFLPTRCKGIDENDSGGLAPELQDEIRTAAFDAIVAWRAGRPVAIPQPSADQLVRMMSISVGESIPSDYGPFMAAKMDSYSGYETNPVTHPVPEGFSVVIIGAGMAGICAAVRLKEAGVPFVIVEKGEDVGGVWRQNKYPGCGVDTPSHLYSYSFAQGDWKHYFGKKPEIENYFRSVADSFGIYEHIRFRSHVSATRYDESAQRWCTDLEFADGSTDRLESNVVISAVGAFGTPKWPAIDGFNTFQGQVLHTAQWDESVDLTGKRVAVIGNGASAMQLVPAIVDDVSSLTIFQRSKQWAAPFPKFKKAIPDPVRFMFSEVPLYEWWYRLRLSWLFDSKVYESLKVDPEWHDPDRSLNAINDGHRRFFTRYIEKELGDRQDLAPKVIPDFPPYGKRMLLDNQWFRTLTRPNVELVDSPIGSVDENGIRLRNGDHHDFDIIIVASGFDVARFLAPVNVYGREGVSIRDAWNDDDPQAYLGTVTPQFPNFFMLYGPNTALGHGGSFIFVVECQVNYILSVLEKMFESGTTEVECREDVCTRYNELMVDMHSRMIWTHPGMSTYYRNSRGRVVANSPWRTTDYWKLTQEADLSDYHTKSEIPASVG
ncbi:flavin-containing monooxygenase [Rhodococcus sp. NPDC056743]|uniref:flavin-containing monooxygenase n=1 Tax=Rhodococcus sp. NPDC056743 TaxID=3345934 RepID=UPI00366D2887